MYSIADIENEKCNSKKPADTPGWQMLGVLSLLMGFASISTDFYLPAMPVMITSLNTDAGMVELTISGYLIGFSLGQLFWGPIGDSYGRRPSVAAGLVLFVMGSAGCAVSQNVMVMIGYRILQAVGASASVVLSRAMIRDLYKGVRAAQMLSTLMTVMAVAPLIGPLAGAQIVAVSGWRAIFWVLVGIGITAFVLLFSIPETLPVYQRSRQSLVRSLIGYGELLRCPGIIGYAAAGGFFYAGMFAYIAGSPFSYITYYHVPAKLYGLLFGLGSVGIMTSNLVNTSLVKRFGYDKILFYGTISAAVSSLITAVSAKTGFGGLFMLVAAIFLFVSSAGFIVANSIAGALADFPERAGAVSALIGAAQYGSGIIGAGLVGIFADGTPWPMGCVIAIGGTGSLLSMWLLRRIT